MINSEKILTYMLSKNIKTNKEEIEKVLDNLNISSLEDAQRGRFRYEIWDKESPINGVSAESIIKSRNYKIVGAYLIYVDEKLVYFQDHKPNEEGYVSMTKKEANNIAQNFIDKKVQENVDNFIIDYVFKKLSSNS